MAAKFKFFLSGGAANANPQQSLGGAKSTTVVNSDAQQNLFANVGTTEATDGSDKYRCIYLQPDGIAYKDLALWISSPTPANDSKIYLSLAPEGINGVAETIPDEDTLPADLIFTRPTEDYQGIKLPDMTANQWIGLWIKRTITAQAQGYDNDYARLTINGVEV